MGIRFRKPSPKILEAILWIADKKPGIDHYHVVKVLFGADKSHLNKYGRPVSGDDYKAMKFGPVPSLAYDFLKENGLNLSDEELNNLEDSIRFETVGKSKRLYPKRKPDLDLFSRTDLECLQWSLDSFGDLSFEELKNNTHKEPAYNAARDTDSLSNAPDMDYALLIDKDNPHRSEIIAHLSEISHGIVL